MSDIKPIETVYNGYKFRSRLEARWAVFFDSLGIKYEYEPEGYRLPSGDKYLPDFKVKCYGVRGGFDPVLPCYDCSHHKLDTIDFGSWFDGFCDLCDPEKDWENCPDGDWLRTSNGVDIIECSKRDSQYPFDLFIEVKGNMTRKDAVKIKEFAMPNKKNGQYGENVIENPILIVGNIPPLYGSHDSDAVGAYNKMNGIDIYPFNYELIDGDHFAAYPAAHNGDFYLWGDDSNYICHEDYDEVERAYTKARQARFEHGETPIVRKP